LLRFLRYGELKQFWQVDTTELVMHFLVVLRTLFYSLWMMIIITQLLSSLDDSKYESICIIT